jgi:transcriptional regulator with XRE-family HTH domain
MLTLENYIQQAPEIKTEINWHEVNNKRYVTLKKNFQIELLKRAIMNAGSQTKLIKFLRKSESQIRRYKKGEFNPTVDTLKRLAEIAKISFEDISKNIVCLGGITNPKLPFCMNNIYGIKIRAKILSDGFNTTNLNYNAGYRAGELESHKNLMLSFKKQIGDFHGEYGVTKPYRNAYSTQFPPVFGDILELSGVPRGWKSIKDPFIPKDILLSVTSLQVAYLCEAFTDEGCIEFSNGYRVVSLNRNIVLGNVNKFKNYTRGLPSEKSVSFKKLPGEFQNKIKGNIPKLILGEYLLLKKLDIDCKLKPKWIRINIYFSKLEDIDFK